jgi:hypothetical protein
MIIAIDGPAASGKGTLGKRLAAHYGLRHLDTGLIYRAVTKALLEAGDRLDDVERAVAAATALDPGGFDEKALKSHAIGEAASIVSALPEVRAALLAFQRDFGRVPPGAVLDGRDIGTVIFPEAGGRDRLGGWRGQRGRGAGRYPAPRRARHPACRCPPQGSPGCALARYVTFGYRRRILGRHRHCRSRPSRPKAGLTALSLWRTKPAPPASLMVHPDLNSSLRSLGRRARLLLRRWTSTPVDVAYVNTACVAAGQERYINRHMNR